MNKTYIKRQLTLHKLGIPMNEDIQEYFDYFNELIGDPNNLTKECGSLYGISSGYLYSKNGNKLLFYRENGNNFTVDYLNVIFKFGEKHNLEIEEVIEILLPLLEYYFKTILNTTLPIRCSVLDEFFNYL